MRSCARFGHSYSGVYSSEGPQHEQMEFRWRSHQIIGELRLLERRSQPSSCFERTCISKSVSCLARCLAAYWLIFQESKLVIDHLWRMHQCLQQEVGLNCISFWFCNHTLVSTASACVHHTARLHIQHIFSILQRLEQPREFCGAELQPLISVGAEENHIQQVSNMMVAWGSKAVMCISNLFHRSPHWISKNWSRTAGSNE